MGLPTDTVPGLAINAARRWPDRPAIIDRDAVLTFAELAAQAKRVARSLLALDIRHGDRVGLWVPNRWEWVAAAIGIHMAGAVLIPLNTRLRGRETADILRRTKISVLVSIGHFLDVFYPAMLDGMELPALRRVVVLGGAAGAAARDIGWADFLALGADTPAETLDQRIAAITGADMSDIMFTSGTTGHPKGAMFSHAQTVAAGIATVRINALTCEDRFATFGPFSHNASYKAGWVAGLACGCAIVNTADMSPDSLVRLIAERQVTVMPGPPTIWQAILDSPVRGPGDLRSLRRIGTGGTIIPVQLVHRLNQVLGRDVVSTGYGLTECCGSVTNTRVGDAAEIVATTTGRAIDGTELRIVDPQGCDLPAGEAGEILVRNASVTLGYLDDPAATAAAVDQAGWLHTGDIGVLDPAGNLRITDRLKDMFIVGGFNCYPAEVEHLLAAMPGIRHSAVIGVADQRLGQVGRAFVVAGSGAGLTGADVIAWCRKNMASYKVPRFVDVVDSLPMTASGKVMKAELQRLAQQDPAMRLPLPDPNR